MSKELKALERIKNFMSVNAVHWKQDISMIGKALKALEIVKRNIKHFIEFEDNTNSIYIDCSINCKTKEDYDLLKENYK